MYRQVPERNKKYMHWRRWLLNGRFCNLMHAVLLLCKEMSQHSRIAARWRERGWKEQVVQRSESHKVTTPPVIDCQIATAVSPAPKRMDFFYRFNQAELVRNGLQMFNVWLAFAFTEDGRVGVEYSHTCCQMCCSIFAWVHSSKSLGRQTVFENKPLHYLYE